MNFTPENLYHVYNQGNDKQIIFSTTKINKFEFVAVDNLFLNKFCEEKKRIRFQ